jgi:uncharacterized protein YaiE (UPF0345 family)
MASTYVNDLRLNEMATGDGSGTWGTTTNTNLELIAEAFSYGTEVITTNADTHTTTIADGSTDPGRSLYLKYTGTLDSACTITIGPDTVSKVWIIENGTSGSQNIIISQGSGANITIPAGDTKVVYSDGAGAGAAFFDAFSSLKVTDPAQTNITSVGSLTALDVAGTATMDAAKVENSTTSTVTISESTGSGTAELRFVATDSFPKTKIVTDVSAGSLSLETLGNDRLKIANNGDISFYEDTGTSPALFWDASAESLGIGTTSPAAPLDIKLNTNSTADIFKFQRLDGAVAGVLNYSGTDGAISLGTTTSHDLTFDTANTERMRIDSSGNVGIGITPSAWQVNNRAIQMLDGYGSISSNNSQGCCDVSSNTYNAGSAATSGWKYTNTAASSLYQQQAGQHKWFTAASGSADAAISWSESMRIDSSGNVGIGTSDPDYNLVVGDAGATAEAYIEIGSTTTGTGNLFFGDTSGTGAGSYSGYVQYDHNTDSMRLGTSSTERMRIDSSGQVGIGCEPGVKLAVAGTGTIGSFSSAGLSSSATLQIQAHNGAGYDARLYFECPGSNSGGITYNRANSRLYAYSQSEFSGPYVVANGTSWTTGSDIRLKTNIEDINYGITSVMALSPKKYNYINNADKKCLGFIAQEVINILPELIDTPEDSETMMGIEYQAFIPVLVKAIQEQQVLIESLTARITTLEG